MKIFIFSSGILYLTSFALLRGTEPDSGIGTKVGPDSAILADAALKAYPSTLAYITETGHLWGISRLEINADSKVVFTDAKSGYGHGLNLVYQKEIKDQVVVSIGNRCCVSDGRSCFIYYKVKNVSAGKVELQVFDIFDGRPLGRDVLRAEKTFWVVPY